MVANLQQHPRWVNPGAYLHSSNVSTDGAAVAAGILEQIGDDAPQLDVVGQHRKLLRQRQVHPNVILTGQAVHAGVQNGAQGHVDQVHPAWAGVIKKLIDDGVELRDIRRHVVPGLRVSDAELGLQAQPCQGRAQVVRDAGKHDGAVVLHFGQLARHAVETRVNRQDFRGGDGLVQRAGSEIPLPHPERSQRQLLEWLVDQARYQGGPGQRQYGDGDQPDDPCLAGGTVETGTVCAEPVAIAIDGEADPEAVLLVNLVGQFGARAQQCHQFPCDALACGVGVKRVDAVTGLPRHDAHAFLLGHGLDQGDPADRVRVHQGGAAQIHQRRDFLRGLQCPGFGLHGPNGLQPSRHTAQQQQTEQEKRTPKQADAGARRQRKVAWVRGQWHQFEPSGTNT